MKMTAVILAGGQATRMNGCDKAFLRINHKSVIKMQLGLLKKIFKQIIIVAGNPKKYKSLKGVKVIPDIIPHLGPLGGIFSGLLASQDKYNFVFACDMPFINPGLIKYMYKNTQGYDVVVPNINDRYEPLFCIYSKTCLKYIRPLLNKGIFRISKLFSEVRVKVIKKGKVSRFGSPERIFANINTPEDLTEIS